jgi:hypothetical protein
MDPFVFAAVLLAAACHAGWNATIKGGLDPLATTVLISIGAAIVAASVRVYSVRNKPAPRDGCWHFPKRNKRKSWRRGIIPARDHLYVVTTNLDAQRTAIWDMGKIAVSGDGAIFLFLFFRSWRSWSQRWSIAPLTSGSARRWRSRALCCQAAPASKQS